MIMIMISMIRIKLVVRTHKTLTDHLTLWTVLCLFNKSLVPIIHIITLKPIIINMLATCEVVIWASWPPHLLLCLCSQLPSHCTV